LGTKFTVGLLLFAFILRILLEFRIGIYIIKYLSWLPARSIFRKKPISLRGKWNQNWASAGSRNFSKQKDRTSQAKISQLDTFCYGEFLSKEKKYAVFGRVVGEYLVGDWFDLKDPWGYFGAFHLEIKDSNTLSGRWIGHSKTKHEVIGDDWIWERDAKKKEGKQDGLKGHKSEALISPPQGANE